MTLAAFQEQFSFKFLPKTVIRKFWRSQCERQRVPDRWSTHRKSTRTRSHCSCSWYSQFQMRRQTQKPTTSNQRNSDAVIGEVDGSATMETFVDQGGHLECHSPSNGNQCKSIIIGVMWSYFLAPDTSRTTAFCTRCSWSIKPSPTPYNNEFQ